jgi:protein-tyrosine phosphatase
VVGSLGRRCATRGGAWLDEEVRAWKAAGIDVVVSSLTAEESTEFALGDEASTCNAHGIRFLSYAISDRSVPDSRQEAAQLLSRLAEFLTSGQNVAIHCRQGIGRSGLIAGALLVLGGATFREAVATISRNRGCEVPENRGSGLSILRMPIIPRLGQSEQSTAARREARRSVPLIGVRFKSPPRDAA